MKIKGLPQAKLDGLRKRMAHFTRKTRAAGTGPAAPADSTDMVELRFAGRESNINSWPIGRHGSCTTASQCPTTQDNSDDMVAKNRGATGNRHGSKTQPHRVARGAQNGSAVLTVKQVKAMRKRRSECATLTELMREFGMSKSQTWRIISGQSWIEG